MSNTEISAEVKGLIDRWDALTDDVLSLYRDIIQAIHSYGTRTAPFAGADETMLNHLERACFMLVNDIHLKM